MSKEERDEFIWLWIATDQKILQNTYILSYEEEYMLIAEHFIPSLVKKYTKCSVLLMTGHEYVQASRI